MRWIGRRPDIHTSFASKEGRNNPKLNTLRLTIRKLNRRRGNFHDSSELMSHENSEMQLSEPIPPPFGHDLRIDSEDDENLERLPAIERDLIMSERYEVLQRYMEEKALYDKYTKKDEPTQPKVPAKSNSTRSGPSGSRKRSFDSYSCSSSDSSSYSSGSDSSYSSDSGSEDEEARTVGKLAQAASEEKIAQSMDMSLSLDVARKLQVTRDQLMASFQDIPSDLRNETLHNMFVRVSSGDGMYVLCRIVGVAERPRSAESGKFDLVVELEGNQTTTVPVSSVSSKEISSDELNMWLAHFGHEVALESARKIGMKQSQVKIVHEFIWDDSTINRILSKRNRSSVKLTLEIAKLRTALQAELGALNSASANMTQEQREAIQENINRLNREMTEHELEYRSVQRAFEEANAHQFGIVAINHRNRTEQRVQDIEEARKKLKNKTSKHEEKKELNPFKRRECKPVVMWDVGKKSPQKESAKEPLLHVPDQPLSEASEGANPIMISDVLELDKLVANVTKAVATGQPRLASVQRSLRSAYGLETAAVWEEQLLGSSVGEIMDFADWKRRVAEEQMDDE